MKKALFAALMSLSLFACKKDSPSSGQSQNNPAPVADFSYSGNNLPAPSQITFTNTSTNASSYTWDFGDNSTSTLSNPTHTYSTGGVYTVRLTATGSGGTNSISKTVNIQAAPTSCLISSVTLTSVPFVDVNGQGWDNLPASGPELYFDIVDISGNVLFDGSSSYFSDVTPGMLPLLWSFPTSSPYIITPLNRAIGFEFYDYDATSSDDLIGVVSFTPSLITTNGYPSTTTQSYGGITVKLGIQWQ